MPPALPTFTSDDVTQEVCQWVATAYADHLGELDPAQLPATAADAATWWDWAKDHCLPHFGPFEDAMSAHHRGLFHSRVAHLLNLQRLLAADLVHDVAQLPIDLASREGFVRQILGWREFVYHVHAHIDGLRALPQENFFEAADDLPAAFWGQPSGMHCLDAVVASVMQEGYSHHIIRLMVLSNLATLLQIDPRQITGWFWVAYTDAYDWVVKPNVLGMGTFALVAAMMTKPYICGSAYIDRMSDFCGKCAFHPKRNCPITPMYWAHLAQHHGKLAGNHRMSMPLMAWRRRPAPKRAHDARVLAWARQTLARGELLQPKGVPKPPK